MPKKIIINETGGPNVLKWVEYSLPNSGPELNDIRIEHTSIGVN